MIVLAATLLAAVITPLFEEVELQRAGIHWVHESGRSEQRHLPESVGPGCAFFDYDNDGLVDIFLVNGGASDFYRPPKPLRNALYRNVGEGKFVDVTERAGVSGVGYGMGAAAADFDNDGNTDLLVTGYGGLTLYRNQGDGAFEDITKASGLRYDGWSTSAAWFDFDADGDLDVFVASYVQYSPEQAGICGKNKLGKSFYCIPTLFKPTTSLLFLNRGDGTFSRADTGTSIGVEQGKALGVVAADVNNDGRMDLFVANDTTPNFLFVNRGDGKWEETGLFAEVAYSADGVARSGMGTDAADINQDGWMDLFVANIDGEEFSLYRNRGDETFEDIAGTEGIARSTRFMSGWGLKFFDFDNDGDVDLLLANGHPDDMIEAHRPNVTYRERLLLFRQEQGQGRTTTREISELAGPAFNKNWPARGLAVGDYDNDGAVDVLVANNGEAPVLLRNRAGAGRNWLGLKLIGKRSNRDAVGAQITWSAGGKKRTVAKNAGGSYLSSHDPRVVLGLGSAPKVDWVEIRWPAPGGKVQRLEAVPLNRYIVVEEPE